MRSSRRKAFLAAALAAVVPSAHAQWGRKNATEGRVHGATPAEKRILDVIADVYRNHQYLSVPQEDGRLLRMLAESTGARNVVEIGTSTGCSGLWLMMALTKTGGRLTTFEADRDRQGIARYNFERAGVGKLATLVLGDAHAQVNKLKEPIDLLFIDADKDGYLDYLTKLLPIVRPGGLILSHNMQSPAPDPAYVQAITTTPELDTVFLNMHDAGIGVTLKKR